MSAKITLDFSKLSKIAAGGNAVVPVVVQDVTTKDVLLLAYVNEQALADSLRTGVATFWSTSRHELWVKGATSGHLMRLHEVKVNCEDNSLLFLVTPHPGGVCHVPDSEGRHYPSCFYRDLATL
jgi:phosphoribosyl-AMP cyclohydrolase